VELPLFDPPDEEVPVVVVHPESLLPQAAARGTPHASTHATRLFVPALILFLPGKLPSAPIRPNPAIRRSRIGGSLGTLFRLIFRRERQFRAPMRGAAAQRVHGPASGRRAVNGTRWPSRARVPAPR
jgi:hypothetical protein